MPFFATAILLLCALLTGGCGHKAPPRPLLKTLPEPVENLRVRQLGTSMLIVWSAPRRNQDGTPIEELTQFDIYRMSYDPADECPECRDTSTLLRSIDPDYLQDAQQHNGRYYLLDRSGLEKGRGYQYRLQAMLGKDLPGAPSKVRQPFFAAPEPLKTLRASDLKQFIRLGWEAAGPKEGMTLRGYRLYRGIDTAPLSLQALNSKLLATPNYDDFDIRRGRTYRYAVRAVWEINGIEIESSLSKLVSILPSAE